MEQGVAEMAETTSFVEFAASNAQPSMTTTMVRSSHSSARLVTPRRARRWTAMDGGPEQHILFRGSDQHHYHGHCESPPRQVIEMRGI